MRVSFTLSKYMGKQLLGAVLMMLLALTGLVLLGEMIELLRRSTRAEGVPFYIIVEMVLLKAPNMAEDLLPYACLLGSMFALAKLTRSHELIVARAAGISVWQFLLPGVVAVMALAVVFIGVINPLAAVMTLKYEQMNAKYIRNQPSLMVLSPSGIWLKQLETDAADSSEYIIHAQRLNQATMAFERTMILRFDKQRAFTERLDAEEVELTGNTLLLKRVIRSAPGIPPEQLDTFTLPTTLKLEQIQDSFASPEAMPFWSLPGFIATLEEAGFSALNHRIYFHSLLASPVLLAGMVLIAAIFSLRLPRRGRVMAFIVAGTASGFVLHFMTQITHALGGSGTLPIPLAAWAPALIVVSLGAASLLHLEDG
jgi:lipopolysaccharide export system permease protein